MDTRGDKRLLIARYGNIITVWDCIEGKYKCTVKEWSQEMYDELNTLVEWFNPIQRTRSYRSYISDICMTRDVLADFIRDHKLY